MVFVRCHLQFGAYSRQLREYLGSSKVAIIGSFGDVGLFSSVLPGAFYAFYGQTPTAILGTTLLTGAYIAAYSTLTTHPGVALFCVLYFFIGQGSVSYSFICLTANSGNFPIKWRGTIIGMRWQVSFGLGLVHVD